MRQVNTLKKSIGRPLALALVIVSAALAGRPLAATEASKQIKVCVEVIVQKGSQQAAPEKLTEESDQAPQKRSPQPKPAEPAQPQVQAPSAVPIVSPTAGPPAPPEVQPAATPSPPPDAEEPVVVQPAQGAAIDQRLLLSSSTPRDPRVRFGAHLPLGQAPEVYLGRLLEHFVTHEPGFVAESKQCDERLRVELYPLEVGWTVFVRYSGNGREERVDQLFPTELSQFAERAVLALLHDVPIGTTINRGNVLKADSMKSVQRVRGTNHFVLGFGTQLRGGMFDTAVEEKGEDQGKAKRHFRVFSPVAMGLGYRGRFESWGLETISQVALGTSKTPARNNPEGGHIDFGGDAGLLLHVLRYDNPRGLTSFYYGAGSSFELLWFSTVRAEEHRAGDTRSTLFGGGLGVDALLGWEFMRANAIQFFLQGELNLPVFTVQNENNHGSINTWFPGISIKLGAIF